VRDAKAAIAAGAAGARWEPAGIRLIWRGRLLRDDEVLGAVLAGFEEPKVHVVARPVTPSERPQPQWETPQQERAQAQAFVPVTDSDSLAEQIARNASTLVRWNPPASATPLADTVHYLMFAAREHMCVIVGRPVLAWEETDPKPTVSRAEAYEAILTVVRAHAGDQWADALQADGDKAAIERAYVAIGRDIAMAEVKYLWRALVGREYGEKGATTQVEFE
jgi:hypothetical protein